MTNKYERDVQGVAVYLEFRKTYSTAQVLITPDTPAFIGDGVTPAQFFRRTISGGATKRKWRAYTIRNVGNQREAIRAGSAMEPEDVANDAVSRLRYLSEYFDSLVRGGYKLVNDTPIYIEVTKDDMLSAREGTLAPKLWSRVKSSRAALGFPEDVVDDVTAHTI